MRERRKNIGASVHQRLLNKARSTGRPFNELMQHYANERFIYRLSQSEFAERFILKGALLLSAWNMPMSRPTKDIDLLGKINSDEKTIVAAIKAICRQGVVDDGLTFNAGSIHAERITENAEYQGVRIRLQGNLSSAQVYLQIDVGFGDVIYPGPSTVV